MNWGLGIVLGLGAFMLFIIGSVIYMVNKNEDSLEDPDYYEKGLNYDEVYTLRENLQTDRATPSVQVIKDTLWINFVKENNKGEMLWRRPSDESLDNKLPFATQGNLFKLPLTSFASGDWQLELRWQNGGREYLSEHNIFISLPPSSKEMNK